MAGDLSHGQAQELLGARVLGALDEEEGRRVDDHVAGCEECRRTLGRLQRAASTLIGAEERLPPDVWERITARIRRSAEGDD